LGNTLTANCYRKAGIIKEGGIVVISPQTDEADANNLLSLSKTGSKN